MRGFVHALEGWVIATLADFGVDLGVTEEPETAAVGRVGEHLRILAHAGCRFHRGREEHPPVASVA